MEMMKRLLMKSTRIVALFVILIYVVVIVAVAYPPTFAFLRENLVLIAGVLAVLAVVIASEGVFTERVKRNIDEDEYKRLVSRETHPVFCTRIVKDVKILDKEGKGSVTYKITCKNTSEGGIPQLIHEIRHDGSLEEYSANINDKMAKVTFEKFIINKVNGNGETPLSHILKIKYDLSDEGIAVGDTFTYGYNLRYSGVFSRMFEPLQEFTAHHVMHPTNLLIMKIATPKGYKFAHGEDKIGIEVKDKHEVRVDREELRCNKLFPPQFFNNDTEIMWEILEPKIACTYALHFTVVGS